MTIPNLKRVKIGSGQELRTWLGNHAGPDRDVMVVTVADRDSAKHVSRETIAAAAGDHGWRMGRAYTLVGGLRGEVIHPPHATDR